MMNAKCEFIWLSVNYLCTIHMCVCGEFKKCTDRSRF